MPNHYVKDSELPGAQNHEEAPINLEETKRQFRNFVALLLPSGGAIFDARTNTRIIRQDDDFRANLLIPNQGNFNFRVISQLNPQLEEPQLVHSHLVVAPERRFTISDQDIIRLLNVVMENIIEFAFSQDRINDLMGDERHLEQATLLNHLKNGTGIGILRTLGIIHTQNIARAMQEPLPPPVPPRTSHHHQAAAATHNAAQAESEHDFTSEIIYNLILF